MILKDYLKAAFAVATLIETTTAIHLEDVDDDMVTSLSMLSETS